MVCTFPFFGASSVDTGHTKGYSYNDGDVTGHVGWGIAWYINGLLVPEVVLVRGRRYTFVVEGGVDPAVPARYHPFYITNDPIGGYFHKSDEEKKVCYLGFCGDTCVKYFSQRIIEKRVEKVRDDHKIYLGIICNIQNLIAR